MLEQAADRGVRSLVVRAGDFFGSHQPASWFSSAIVKAGRPVGAIAYPGDPDVGHTWAYLPDLAETIAQIAALEGKLPAFGALHFAGHWLEPGAEIVNAVRRVAERPALPLRRFPWPLIYLGAPFVPFFREILEMRYLWRIPLRLDNRKLVALIGREPHTALDVAVRQTLVDLGCLAEAFARNAEGHRRRTVTF